MDAESKKTILKPIVSSLPSKNKPYKQLYRKDWETVSDFKAWLQPVEGQPSRAFCKFCNKMLHAHRLTLLKHTCTLKHSRNAQRHFLEAKKSVTTSDKNKPPPPKEKLEIPNKVEPVDSDEYSENGVEPEVSVKVSPSQKEPDKERPVEVNAVSPVTVHVLDICKGLPCSALGISLYKLVNGRWTHISDSCTNPVGRCEDLITRDNLKHGRFKLHFDVQRYYEMRNQDISFPFIEIAFDVKSPSENYHIPLLLSPHSYTTYQGQL